MNVLKMSCFLEVCMYVNNELYLLTVLSVLQAKFFFFFTRLPFFWHHISFILIKHLLKELTFMILIHN